MDLKLENLTKFGYTSCTYTITNTVTDECFSDVAGWIRGRGNRTWEEFDKKPFSIKFEDREKVKIEVYILNEDGTVTFEIWKLK